MCLRTILALCGQPQLRYWGGGVSPPPPKGNNESQGTRALGLNVSVNFIYLQLNYQLHCVHKIESNKFEPLRDHLSNPNYRYNTLYLVLVLHEGSYLKCSERRLFKSNCLDAYTDECRLYRAQLYNVYIYIDPFRCKIFHLENLHSARLNRAYRECSHINNKSKIK